MAEKPQQQDKTEEATPKRREDARKKGNVPRSRELSTTCVMLGGASGLLLLSGPLATNITSGMSAALAVERQHIFDPQYMPQAFASMMSHALVGLLP